MPPDPPATPREWFEASLGHPPDARSEWLARHCHDQELRARVTALLAADGNSSGVLNHPVAGIIEDLQPPGAIIERLLGTRIGGFRLVRLLGEGGMATVFLGERQDRDFTQSAAIKLLRRGLYSDVEQRLFRRERQTLASLSHANIAHLIDGGVTEAGVPYLIMEYVDGVPVTRHAVEQQLDVRERLRVFVSICRAVEAAHNALVVHRDIKPSNILVDSRGVVKLLDFGIAKLLDDDDATTRTGMVPLTPEYAAPEQLAGGTITTATDVYALGVLLHELLLGERPGDDRAERRPSSRVAELTTDLWQLPGNRATLRSALKGDLDNVLLKALASEPRRRYASAGMLADDIERHLAAQPVSAHPPSRWYRTRKFVQRHRGGVAVSAALLLAVIASLGVALWQAHLARTQAQRAENTRDFLLAVFEAAKDQLPRDARPTPDVLARAAAKRVDADARLDPATRAEFLGTLGLISQTGSDYTQARDYAERALAVLEAGGDSGSRRHLAIEIARIDALLSLGETDDADAVLRSRIDAIREVADETAVRGIAAYSATRLASGALNEAVALAREASRIANTVFGPTHEKALTASLLPGDSIGGSGNHRQAVVELGAALAGWDASGVPPNRDYVNSLQNLASSYCFIGDYDRCERLLRDALDLAARIFEPPHEKIADIQQTLGGLLSLRRQRDAAEPLLRGAAETYATLFGPDHPALASVQASLATLAYDREDFPEAALLFEEVTRLCTRAHLESDPTCGRTWQNLSSTYVKLHRLKDAEVANARSLQLRRALYGERHGQYANALGGRGSIRLAAGNPAGALADFDQALAINVATGHGENLESANMHGGRARALVSLQRGKEALAALDVAERINLRLVPDDGPRELRLLSVRVDAQRQLGLTAAAKATARRALALEAPPSALEPPRWEVLRALAE